MTSIEQSRLRHEMSTGKWNQGHQAKQFDELPIFEESDKHQTKQAMYEKCPLMNGMMGMKQSD